MDTIWAHPQKVREGNLHQWNILSTEREPWLALDSKGVISEHEYEVGVNHFSPCIRNIMKFGKN